MRRAGLILSIGGGKGGVGKSLVAANLSVSIAQLGHRVTLVDADLGAANQHTLFGIDRPGPSLHALRTHDIDDLAEAAVATCVPGLCLVPGSSAAEGAANPNHAQKQRLLRQIAALSADVVVVDLGAGVSYNVLDLFLLGDVRVLVMAPQLTSLQNAYGAAKGAVMRVVRRALGSDAADDVAPSRELDRVASVLTHLDETDPPGATRARAALAGFGLHVIGNQIGEAGELRSIEAVSRMIRDYLAIDAPVVGALPLHAGLRRSVARRRPFVLDSPDHPVAGAFRRAAAALLAAPRDAAPDLARSGDDPGSAAESR